MKTAIVIVDGLLALASMFGVWWSFSNQHQGFGIVSGLAMIITVGMYYGYSRQHSK